MATSETAAEPTLKDSVRAHWENETCGTRYGSSTERRQYFEEIEASRYAMEPYIPEFAQFAASQGQEVLEIGVGAGSDFSHWLRNGARATGIDLTEAAIQLTTEHLEALEIETPPVALHTADAENLPFEDASFDVVYSWGVLHHSPDTEAAFRQVCRVLRPGAEFRGMVYHVPSWTGWMVWAMQSLLKGKPFRSAKQSLYEHLESPGTKAYSLAEAHALLERAGFEDIRLQTRLNPGDLMLIRLSEKYDTPINRLIHRLYPRWLVRLLGDRFGLNLMIEARRPV